MIKPASYNKQDFKITKIYKISKVTITDNLPVEQKRSLILIKSKQSTMGVLWNC